MLILVENEDHHGLPVYKNEDGVRYTVCSDEEADKAARNLFLESIETVSIDVLLNWLASEKTAKQFSHSEWSDFQKLIESCAGKSGFGVLSLMLLGDTADDFAQECLDSDGREYYLSEDNLETSLGDLLSPEEISELGLTPKHCVFEI